MEWLTLASPVLAFGLGLAMRGWWKTPAAAPVPADDPPGERRADMVTRLEENKHVIESAGIGTYFWDPQGDTVRWSPHHYTIFGWPQDMPVTHAMFRDRVHPDDLAAVDAAIDTAMRDGADYAIQFRLRFEDGSTRYVRGSGRVKLDDQGRPASVNGAVVDVTEAAQARSVSRQRELDLAAVALYLPDILARFDREGRCLFMSPRVESITGHPPEFYVGKRPLEFGISPNLAARWGAVIEDVVLNNYVREFDFTYADHHAVDHFFITRALPSLGPEGRVETVLTISSDHTEREHDARQVREDGASLQRADQRKNEYLATLAHELRGPLAPISSAAQLIRFSNDRVVRNKAREVIERQVKQLAELVDDLMEVGRISSGKLEIKREPVSVQHVIEQAVESTVPLLDKKNQQLHCVVPDMPLWLEGDAMRLIQVFSNLLTNASKYSPVQTAIGIEASADDTSVTIAVRDQGIGLSAESMASIFDLFVQVHATGVQAQGGLGIGLSLVRQLVELHGGQVSVSSPGVGKGSVFTVVLPRAQQEAQAALPSSLAAAPASLKVLVVDDNVDGATTLALLLETLGHTAVVAYNGLDAVRLAAQEPIDMAFLDLGLPDISGIQVALRIRGTPKGRKLPLIALTGLGRDEDRHLTRAAQFDEHVTKPLQIDELVRITREVAERRPAG